MTKGRTALRTAALCLMLLAGACSSSSTASDPTAVPTPTSPIPRFEPGPAQLQELVGTTFVGDLPDELRDREPTARSAGAAIVNAEVDPADDETVAMHWVVGGDHGDFLVTTMADRDELGTPVWRIRSTWRLVIAPDMVVTFGTVVCAAPADSYDGRNGDFLAVTNQRQDRALAAWTMTIDGPIAYPGAAGLDCERFTP